MRLSIDHLPFRPASFPAHRMYNHRARHSSYTHHFVHLHGHPPPYVLPPRSFNTVLAGGGYYRH